MKSRFWILTVLVLLGAGCARVTVSRVTPENAKQPGLRFYRPHPYLWVTKDKEGALQGVVIWLPDKNEEYAVKVSSGIGSANLKLKLDNGWNLTEFGEVRDSRVPETIAALTGSLKDLSTTLAGAQRTTKATLLPGLYMFVFDPKTGLVNDLVPVVQFDK